MKNLGKAAVLSTGLLFGSLSSTTIPLLSNSTDHVEAASIVKFSKASYQTTTNLRLRSGASTKKKTILTIPKGKTVTSSQKLGSWYKVSYTYKSKGKNITKTGWVSGSYLKKKSSSYQKATVTKPVSITKTNMLTTANVNLRKGASTKNKIITTVKKSKVVKGYQKLGKWYKVQYTYSSKGKTNNKYGWVSGDYLKEYNQYTKTVDTYYSTKKTVKLYSAPNTKKAMVTVASKTVLYSTQKVANSTGQTWYRVLYKSKYYYVYNGDVNKVSKPVPKPTEKPVATPSQEKTYLVTADLNLRKSGAGSTVLATIPNGSSVKSSGELSDDWYKVTYAGKTGYVSSKYLKEYQLTDYRFIDLRTKSTVTAGQINAYIAANYKRYGTKSVLFNKGQAFINAGNKYGINALYLAAHAIHESAYGTSNISIGKYNLFGYGAYDATPFVGAYRFSSVEQCINYVAQKMKADYLNPRGTHFEGAMLGYRTNDKNGARIPSKSIGMNYWYASDPQWGKGIANHMQKIMAFNKKLYENPKIDTRYFSVPAIPSGSDKFPEGIQVVAKKDLSSVIKKGKVFDLVEKTNSFQVKVTYNKKTYTLSNISFSSYKNYISAYNLGRVVKASTVNVRSSTTTSSSKNIIGKLSLNQYVSLALDKKYKVIMDSSKKWYKINLGKGKKGWISASYVIRELQ
ncbi:SH3 domain-containing protein [Bacillus rubiinfantis]|uniref:SH3 domain-containing protein n=1 Tax=Bacillus rubiinfantis TaxID=1499680 RepID=UPI0005AAB37E|nr:SH3 domain-containing protein [Bacillus rubiinfantis]